LHRLRLAAQDQSDGARLAWLPADEGARLAGLPGAAALAESAVFLGSTGDGEARFALDLRDGPPDGLHFEELRPLALRLPAADAAVAAQARSLVAWHRTHLFCARCGSRTVPSDGGWSRRCTRSDCAASHFPRTDPVVIMLVHRGNRVLVGRSVREPPFPPGLWSCLAGYVEPGESVEEAVRREVREESGVPVGTVRYHSSQPWPFPSSLMIGCFAEALGDEIVIDPSEVEAVRWLRRQELEAALARWEDPGAERLPGPVSAAHRLARAWLDGER
jgi:NAD+ diphosphatase